VNDSRGQHRHQEDEREVAHVEHLVEHHADGERHATYTVASSVGPEIWKRRRIDGGAPRARLLASFSLPEMTWTLMSPAWRISSSATDRPHQFRQAASRARR
jgi:hypothetical protein